MADEYAEQRPRVFISYSRIDSEFAYRLRADLEARGFATWIDTAKLGDEGGQDWIRIIEKAVDSCQAMALILSPDSVASNYVHMEYHRIQKQPGKLLIPLHYRTVAQVPMDLDLTQWIEFREGQGGPDTYQAGLNKLIRSLGKAPQPPKLAQFPQPPVISTSPQSANEMTDRPEFQPVPKAPPDPPPEVQGWIAGAFAARSEGNLANEEYFLQMIVDSGDFQEKSSYAKRLAEVTAQLNGPRIDRLRKLAREAASEKQWRRALGAWQALLRLQPDDFRALYGVKQARAERAAEALRDGEFDEAVGSWQALLRDDKWSSKAQQGLRTALRARADDAWKKVDWARAIESWEALRTLTAPEQDADEFLSALAQNRSGDHRYHIAQQLLDADNSQAAHAALEELYQLAPYYGDPSGIAAQLGYHIPHSPQEQLEEQLIAKKAQQETKHRINILTVLSAIIGLLLGPGNYVGVAIASATRAGEWWTGAMFSKSWTLAWMSLLANVGLFVVIEIAAVFVGAAPEKDRKVRFYVALNIALALGILGCWGIALAIYTRFQHGMDWTTLGITAGGGVLGMVVVGGIATAVANWLTT